MHRIILILLLFSPVASVAQQWLTFNDTEGLFSATYPDTWVNKVKEGNRVFFTSPLEDENDAFRQNINISVSTNPGYGTTYKIKEVTQDIFDNVKKSFSTFKEESTIFIKWNGVDAVDLTYSGTTLANNGMEVRMLQRICFYKTRMYIITYSALKNGDTFETVAKQIIDSIKFK